MSLWLARSKPGRAKVLAHTRVVGDDAGPQSSQKVQWVKLLEALLFLGSIIGTSD